MQHLYQLLLSLLLVPSIFSFKYTQYTRIKSIHNKRHNSQNNNILKSNSAEENFISVNSSKDNNSINNIIDQYLIIKTLHLEQINLKTNNKLLFSWLYNYLDNNSDNIYHTNWNIFLNKLKNSSPSYSSVTLYAASSANTTAILNFTIKPYILIPSLLKTKSQLLSELNNNIQYTYNQATQLLFSLEESRNIYTNISKWYKIQTLRNVDYITITEYTSIINKLILNMLYTTSGHNSDDNYMNEIFIKYCQWTELLTTTLTTPTLTPDHSLLVETTDTASLSPFALFLKFYDEHGATLPVKDSTNTPKTLATLPSTDQFNLQFAHLIAITRSLRILKGIIQSLQTEHEEDVRYYKGVVQSLDLLGPSIAGIYTAYVYASVCIILLYSVCVLHVHYYHRYISILIIISFVSFLHILAQFLTATYVSPHHQPHQTLTVTKRAPPPPPAEIALPVIGRGRGM